MRFHHLWQPWLLVMQPRNKRAWRMPQFIILSSPERINRMDVCVYHSANKGPYSQSYNFTSSHVWMWDLDHKESWAPKNWCLQIVVLEKTLESALDSKEIKPVNPKGNQPCIFTGRTDAEAEAPILWPPDVKNWLTGKDPDAGKDSKQKEKGGDTQWDG